MSGCWGGGAGRREGEKFSSRLTELRGGVGRTEQAQLGPGRAESEPEATTEDCDRIRKIHSEIPVLIQLWEERRISG